MMTMSPPSLQLPLMVFPSGLLPWILPAATVVMALAPMRWLALLPGMANDLIFELIRRHETTALGWKLSGAGGGGYLILVSEKPIASAVRIRIYREGR